MNSKSKESNPYKTLSVIITGFIVIYALFFWKWALLTALITGIFGLISKNILHYIIFIWDKISLILSKIVPNILLASVYYLFLTPVALLSKLVTKSDHLMLKNNSDSLFMDYNKEISKSDFEKPW